jgi:dihydrodipicolinate synthase/N-acetylneuraminate lyase
MGNLRGVTDSLFTPFSGTDGDELDLDSYRALVRYCLGDLDHDGLWLTSGLAEWWSLTMDDGPAFEGSIPWRNPWGSSLAQWNRRTYYFSR